MLKFDLTDGGDGATQLRAQAYAQFPGLLGFPWTDLRFVGGPVMAASRGVCSLLG
jgi:hypothetical protein